MVRNVQGYQSFTLHVLYNPLRPESVAAKAQMIHSVDAIFEACKFWSQAAELWAVPLRSAARLMLADSPQMVSVGVDEPTAFNDARSPMLTATQAVHVNVSAAPTPKEERQFAAFVQWSLQQQQLGADGQTLVDLVLEPHSGCGYGDLLSRAMYGGAKWEFNEHALLPSAPAGESSPAEAQEAQARPAAPREEREADREAPAPPAQCKRIQAASDAPVDFVLYLMAGPGNFYQTDALGFSAPDAAAANTTRYFADGAGRQRRGLDGDGCPPVIPDVGAPAARGPLRGPAPSGMVQGLISAFGLRSGQALCGERYPAVEPDYSGHGGVCLMCGQAAEPFFYNDNPMTVEYASVYVPGADLRRVLSWAMHHRTAAIAGYNVDLRLVPLTGCPRQDFLPWALKAGADWRLNAHPLGG